MITYTKSRAHWCPQCGERGHLEYIDVPESKREYTNIDGEIVSEFFGDSKDFSCRSCGCEFTLTTEGG